ncbi:MAG: sugar ABC transporter permease, partial [Streptomyces sp.]
MSDTVDKERGTEPAGTGTPAPANGDAVAPGAAPVVDPRLLVREQGFAGYLTDFKRRVRGGELGSLPV